MPDFADDPLSPSGTFASASASSLGSALQQILMADDIQPGSELSYQLAKLIYLYHPLGGKMAEAPVTLAQSQEREVVVAAGPNEVAEAFLKEWSDLGATRVIANVATQSRVYALATVAMVIEGKEPTEPVPLWDLWKEKVSFNVWDPLNTSGLVTNQDPNSPMYQKHGDVVCNGQRYHRSRTLTLMNEESIYIAWTTSAFAYAGRSCYQRGLYPLKSFINSMVTSDLILKKAGVFIAKMESPGSIIDRAMQFMWGIKRNILKQSQTSNVVSIGLQEDVQTLNMQNAQVYDLARNNVIKDIATSDNMPAKLLTQEAFVEGFGEGTQDAYAVAQYGERFRLKMKPIYDWFDLIVMHRAWNEEWYRTIQETYPEEYGDRDYKEAFYLWKKAFQATWPSLIREPESDAVNVDDVKLKAVIASLQVVAPILDRAQDAPNTARLVQWFCDQIGERENLFGGEGPDLDFGELMDKLAEQYERAAEQNGMGGGNLEEAESAAPSKPFSGRDSASVADLAAAMARRRG